jgi:hypothetical protein
MLIAEDTLHHQSSSLFLISTEDAAGKFRIVNQNICKMAQKQSSKDMLQSITVAV